MDLVGFELEPFSGRKRDAKAASGSPLANPERSEGSKEYLVDLVGFEPTTSSMPWKRAPNCATGPLTARTSLILRRGTPDSQTGRAPFQEHARVFGQIN